MKTLPTAPHASRRALLMGLAATATPMAPALANALSGPAPAGADPIFAAIKTHRAAVHAVNAADDVTCKMRNSDPGQDAAEEASDEASEDEMDALRDVLRCRPTTIEGVLALLDHLGRPQFLRDSRDPATVLSGAFGWDEDEQDELKALPHLLADALRNIIERGQA